MTSASTPASPSKYQFAIRDIVNSIVGRYSSSMNSPYGQCPVCGADGVTRERRIGGNDRCENGHEYPSSTAVHKDEYARRHKPASGQLGLFEKPEERQKPLFSKKVDDEAGKWVTMRGARVFISGEDGRIMKGPKALMGKTKEQIEKESAGKEGGGERKPKPKGLAEMGKISGGRKENRQQKLFEELNPGFTFVDDGDDEEEDFKVVEPVVAPVAAEAPSSPADNVDPISALTDSVLHLRPGHRFEQLQLSLGVKKPAMGKQGTKNVQDALRKIPGGNVIAAMLATGSEHGHLVEFDSNGFPQIGNDAFQKAVDGKFSREDLNAAKEFLETNYSNSTEFGNVNQYRWLSGVARVAKPKTAAEEDEEPSFTLDSTTQPSPAKTPEPLTPNPAIKQGALFDTGKNTKDLKGQELLLNSDAGDLNNPKTMENRVLDAQNEDARKMRLLRGRTDSQIENYNPEKSVRKSGRQWTYDTVDGNSGQAMFSTKREAIEMAKAHHKLVKDWHNDPAKYQDLTSMRASAILDRMNQLQSGAIQMSDSEAHKQASEEIDAKLAPENAPKPAAIIEKKVDPKKTLSAAVKASNKKNEPEGGWTDADRVPDHLQSVKKQDDGPNDGDTNAEGLVFRDGRWHRDEDEQPAEESPSSPADPESQFSGSFDPETHGDYKSFLQLSRKIDSGELSFEEFQQAHKFYTENKEAFVGDLQKRYDAKTLRNIAGNLGDWQAIRGENKKNQNAESVYAAMMQRAFNVGEGISNIYSSDDIRSDGGMSGAAVRRLAGHVAKQTPESLAAHVEKEAKNIAEYAAANKANEEAAANPKTLKDFELAIKKVGSYEKLTTEQQETYDNLMSEKTRTGRDEVKKPTVVEAKVSGDHGGFELTKNFHSKRGQDIFTASPKNRVERDEYDKMNTAAKRLGGWYYKQFGGTPGGFHFPDEDKRNRFLQAMAGEKVDRSDILGEKQEEREKTIGEKLADHAERLEERASASYSAERKENTNRRAGMAASARASAEHDLNQAVRLRSISEAMAGGEVKHLRGMNALTQLESLQRVWRQAQRKHEEQKLQDKYGEEWRSKAKHDEREHTYQAGVNPDSIAHAKIPRQIIYPANVQRFLEQAANTPGLKQESAKWQKLFKRHTNDEKENLTLSKNSSKEWFDFANRAKSKGVKHDWGGFGEKDDFQRLYAMGIQEDHELRSALRELAPHQAKRHGSVQKDPVKELEKKIHREHKAEGFYPTPPRVIDRLMEHADIRDGQSVLEPSAGSGRIMDAVKAAHGDSVSLKGIEHHYALQDLLKMKGHEVEHDDFLQHKGEYDRIVMNPPFENDAAIDHVQHAFSLLKPGGKLVAVVPGGDRMYREAGRNKRKAFADFVDEHGEFEELPEASFAGSDAPRQTGVNTSLVILKKPEAPGAEKYSRLHIYEAMNGVIDRYVRPESEGVDSVQVDKYAHPLIHAAVGAGAMYLANKAFRGPMRSVAHMAIAAAMSAWMQSAMAAHGIPPAQGNQASSSSAVQPLTAGERAKSANNSFDSIVQNAIAKHEQRSKAAENAPPSAAQTAADAVVGDAVNGGSSAPQETAGKEGDRAVRPLKNRQDSNGASGGGSFNGDHPRHPAGSPQSKGGEFAPKGGEESGGQSGGSSALEASSPAESSSESPRNYPDNLNKPASEQTNYSPPERAIEPTDSAKPAEPEKSPEQLYQEHLAKIAASKVDTGDNRQRPDRRAAWEQTQQAMTQQILADKQSKKDEAKKVREIQKATSFNPSELEAESSQDQTERQARKNVIPDIANEHDLDHETLSNAVQDELKMVLPAHQRQEEARHYIAKLGWHAGRINRNEDSYKDHSTTNLDENASEWAGLFPEIAGTDESEWVAKMWDLSKKGKQDPPSASDEDFVRSVAKRLVIQGYASSFSAGEESSNGDDENDEDYQPVHGQIGDVDYTPFSRAAVVGLIVDKYMRLAGIC